MNELKEKTNVRLPREDLDTRNWRDEAREALTAPRAPQAPPRELLDDDARVWDIRAEPRAFSWSPRWHELQRIEEQRPRVHSTWAWWEVLAPLAITASVIARLAWTLAQ